MDRSVRVRFAPSPTGYLHIGGVRTALFNWLFARQHGGEFILRIDDTDTQRNVSAALEPILAGFRWLGLDWDEGPDLGGPCGPYFQSQRRDRHAAAVETLLEKGLAYTDYARPEEIQAERQAAEKSGRPFRYSRRWMAETPDTRKQFETEGRQVVIRLKMPRSGECLFQDQIRGEMRFAWAGEQDHVIQRADGSCLYHLASAVDDADFGITHIIRAIEHLANTPRQIFILQGLERAIPEFAHLPYVAEPGSSNKLSKRKLQKYLGHPDFRKLHERGREIMETLGEEPDPNTFNPVLVDFYREIGFSPEALLNYLLLLGWSLDDSREDFTVPEMIESFSLGRVNRAPASFDPAKLQAFQARHARELGLEERYHAVLPFVQRAGWVAEPPHDAERTILRSIVEAAGDRIKIGGDILNYGDFYTADGELPMEEKALRKRLINPPAARGLLEAYAGMLGQQDEFTPDDLEAATRHFVEQQEVSMGQIVHAVRVAVTGKAVGFGLWETMAILGRERVLRRIGLALDRIQDAKKES